MTTAPFPAFPKIPRLRRNCTITEKLDGTNASIHIEAVSGPPGDDGYIGYWYNPDDNTTYVMRAGSRKRWITPDDDNYGFANWVAEHQHQLRRLGPGAHYGEWWGQGIQRNYGLNEKRFSLFNTKRWTVDPSKPDCCHVVPVLYEGVFDTGVVNMQIDALASFGSKAAPGFERPEGVIVFQHAGQHMFKQLIENDEIPKGLAA